MTYDLIIRSGTADIAVAEGVIADGGRVDHPARPALPNTAHLPGDGQRAGSP